MQIKEKLEAREGWEKKASIKGEKAKMMLLILEVLNDFILK